MWFGNPIGNAKELGVGLLIAVFAVVVGAGCSGDRDQPQQRIDDGWSFGDVSPDGTSDGEDGMSQEPDPIEFNFINEGSRAVWVQQITGCQPSPPGWIRLRREGEVLTVTERCNRCTCREVAEGEMCGGPCPGDCAAPTVERIGPAEQASWRWSGTYLESDEVDGQQCLRHTIPEEGTELSAKVCWGDVEGDTDVVPRQLEQVRCKTVTFRYGETDKVDVVVRPEQMEGPHQTKFVLKNESNRQVRVRPTTDCRERPEDWLRVRDPEAEGAPRVDIGRWCGECLCGTVEENGGCARCGAACVEPKDRILNAGDSISLSWEGYRYESGRVDGMSCLRQSTPATGKAFGADICWWELEMTTEGMEPMQTCETVDFEYGKDQMVVHTVEPK